MTTHTDLTDDELVDRILTWSGRVAAGEAELLVLIGELDRREAWAGPGLLSCAHWLSWRTGLGQVAAREKVRVARALEAVPLVAAELSAGRLSYSQVRAITRVATPEEQQRWIDVARTSTAGQLERVIRGVRRARKPDEDAADPERAAWRLRATKTYDDDGNAVYRIVLPAEQAAVLDAALAAARLEVERQRAADGSSADGSSADGSSADGSSADGGARDEPGASAEADRPQDAGADPGLGDPHEESRGAGRPVSLVDALLHLASTALEGRSPAAARRTRAALTAQIDPLTGWGRLRDGELLPPASLRAVMRTLPGRGGTVRLVPLTPRDLEAHDSGRRQRMAGLPLRELLGTVDGECCRFPGCTRRSKLQAHHVVEWSRGGRTDFDNLVLLCSRHHCVVHQLGFALALHDDRRLDVRTAGGVAVARLPELPWRPAGELDLQRQVTASTLPPDHVRARVDLDYAVLVLARQAA